jgi:hypothetical protein
MTDHLSDAKIIKASTPMVVHSSSTDMLGTLSCHLICAILHKLPWSSLSTGGKESKSHKYTAGWSVQTLFRLPP